MKKYGITAILLAMIFLFSSCGAAGDAADGTSEQNTELSGTSQFVKENKDMQEDGTAAETPDSSASGVSKDSEKEAAMTMTIGDTPVQTTTSAGDIVLYSGDQIVVFYGSNSWAYTRLGKITDKTDAEMADLLNKGDVTITIASE